MFLVPWVDRFKNNGYFNRFGQGIRIGVLSLILFAVGSYGIAAVNGWLDWVIALAAFVVLVVFERKLHPIVVILSCGGIGAMVF